MFLYRQPTGSSDSFAAASMETLKLYAAPWNNPVLDTLLMDMQQAALDQDACRVNIRRGLKLGYGFGWAHIASKKSRALSTVILSREKKKSIVEDIHAFLHPVTRRYYEERGIPYRRGYLLHGLPGTGKSTLCFVLAGLLGTSIPRSSQAVYRRFRRRGPGRATETQDRQQHAKNRGGCRAQQTG